MAKRPGRQDRPEEGGEFQPGEFDDIDLPTNGSPGDGEEFDEFDVGAEAEAAWPMGDLEAARQELEARLITGVVQEAMAAESGTDSYGFENIVGVGIGEKLVNGHMTGDPCVIVYVVSKAPRNEVASAAAVPPELHGVPTDVVSTGELHALPFRGRYRPVPGGVSVGHFRITAGTVGCLVRKGRQLFILSNNHVLANSNNARPGDPILQPGPADGGQNPRDIVARLSNFIRINFSGGANLVDAAIAQTSPRIVTPRNIAFGRIGTTPLACRVGLPVKKAGRTTQRTRGRITDCSATLRVNYGPAGVALFSKQIVIQSVTSSPFSAGGDSGSLIMADTAANRPVGLLFAGSASHTIANPIATVLSALGVSIVSG